MFQVKYKDGHQATPADPTVKPLVAAPSSRVFRDWCSATGTSPSKAIHLRRESDLRGLYDCEVTLIRGEFPPGFLALMAHRAEVARLTVHEATVIWE